jgi:hypothetical protein
MRNKYILYKGFDVFTALKIDFVVLWVVVPCSVAQQASISGYFIVSCKLFVIGDTKTGMLENAAQRGAL